MYIIINDEIEYVFLVLRILKLKSHNENQIFINMNHQSYISFNKSSVVWFFNLSFQIFFYILCNEMILFLILACWFTSGASQEKRRSRA